MSLRTLFAALATRHSGERFKRDVLLLVQAGCFAAAAASFTPLLSQDIRLLDLASQFVLQYLLISVAGMVAALVLRKKILAIAAIAGLALCSRVVIPYYRGEGAAPGGTPLKVFTANVLTENIHRAEVAETIVGLDADIIVLNEVSDEWVQALSALSQRLPYSKSLPRDDNFGIAVFSKFPLESAAELRVPDITTPTLTMALTVNGRHLRLIATHPLPPIDSRLARLRNRQLAEIARLVRARPEPAIVIGDLNTTPWSASGRRFLTESALHEARKGFGVLTTWPSFLGPFGIPIDHILFTPQLHAVSARTVPLRGSDHIGLLADLRISAE